MQPSQTYTDCLSDAADGNMLGGQTRCLMHASLQTRVAADMSYMCSSGAHCRQQVLYECGLRAASGEIGDLHGHGLLQIQEKGQPWPSLLQQNLHVTSRHTLACNESS